MEKQEIKWYVDLAETKYRTEKFKETIIEVGFDLSRFMMMIKDPDIFSPYLGEQELKTLEKGMYAGHRPFFVEEKDLISIDQCRRIRDRFYLSPSDSQYEEVRSWVEPLLPKYLTDEASKLRKKVEAIKRDRFETMRKSEYFHHLETIEIMLQEAFDRLESFPRPSDCLTVLTEDTPIVISRKTHLLQEPKYKVDRVFTDQYEKALE